MNNNTITKETLATLLNGREYLNEITLEEEAQAKAAGLVVVFGYSDDNMELRGAINDEVGCFEGGEIMLCKDGVIMDWDYVYHEDEREVKEYITRKRLPKSKITAIWDDEDDEEYDWIYETNIPHAAFDIMAYGKKYCRGIVFNVADIGREENNG
jgi:hypothetical protein